MPTPHIEANKNEISNIVIMPGDPKRAKYIAEKYLTNTKLVNQVRGMSAYTGYYQNKRITIFPSGMGIPSMGIYSYELFNEYDVDYIIRIGTMGAYSPNLNIGDVILAERSYSDSSFAKIQSNYQKNYLDASEEIIKKIEETSNENDIKLIKGNIYTSDVFYGTRDYKEIANNYNVLGVEMETFGLLHNAKISNKKAASILTVSDSFSKKEELTSEEREKNLDKMIELALKTSLKL